MWGGAALVLGLMPFDQLRLLSVAPVLFLMFFVKATEQRPAQTQRSACPKCASVHSPNQNFCTKCGWDLSLEYSPEGSDTVLASEMHQPQASSTATIERPADTPAEPSDSSSTAESSAEPVPDLPSEAERVPETAPEPSASPSAESAGQTHEPGEPEAPPRPWGLPQPGPAPTAEVMTARGAALLSEGKLQEAIDQFTKAIALDPKHREAFERRAEAYTQQGRGERAEEDYRQVQALNAGS